MWIFFIFLTPLQITLTPIWNSQLLFWQLWYFFNWHTLSSTRLGGILFCVCEVTIKSQNTQCLKILKNVSLYYIRKNYFLARKFNFFEKIWKIQNFISFYFWQENSNGTFLGFFKYCVAKALQPFHVQFVSKWSLEVHLLNWIDHSSRKKINYVDFKTSCLVDKWAPLHHHVFLVLL